MKQTTFALVDCNNFFVSCERIFRPDFEDKPVVVLSSNDGCAVARSNEAKDLGIPMGAPAFKFRELFKKNRVQQFSANFELYGDISKRIVSILTELTPRIEIYSIDEAFLELSQLATKNYEAVAAKLRQRIWNEVGIPVSVGIAPSKTLAKLASEYAKKDRTGSGSINLYPSNSSYRDILQATPIEKVWGVGRRLTPKLRSEGISTAYELSKLRIPRARQLMGVRGEQMIRELKGETCFQLGQLDTKPKSIARTRTFGEDTNQFHVLESAIANFIAQASFRLRSSNQLARRAGLFVMTNRHKPGFRSWNSEIVFDTPTADTGEIIKAAIKTLHNVFEPTQSYHRAGIWLYDFVPAEYLQTDLLGNVDTASFTKAMNRMQSLDALNKRYGQGTVRYAAEDLSKKWTPQRKLRSPRYTTKWDEIPSVKFKG